MKLSRGRGGGQSTQLREGGGFLVPGRQLGGAEPLAFAHVLVQDKGLRIGVYQLVSLEAATPYPTSETRTPWSVQSQHWLACLWVPGHGRGI